ncbi:MAG: hypothetical protein ACFFCF_08370 [Promethearchaeota archaeon]
MVFCPTAGGPCQGRDKCRIWIRGRILYTDSKLLAVQLAESVIEHNTSGDLHTIPMESRTAFWQNQGISNIQREILIDRYLREKVEEVETLAVQWLQSAGFQERVLNKVKGKTKVSSAPHRLRCKSPP